MGKTTEMDISLIGRSLRVIVALLSISSAVLGLPSQAGAIFLLIQPSPTMNGLGGIGTCLPTDEPFAGYYNPANGIPQLRGVSFSSSKMNTDWLRRLVPSMSYSYGVKRLAIASRKLPVQFTLSQHKTFLDLGQQTRTDEQGNPISSFNSSYMKADAWTLALSYRGSIMRVPIDLSVGATRKTVVQKLVDLSIAPEGGYAKATDEMTDYGVLLSVPLRFQRLRPFNQLLGISITPAFGYSVSNIGDEITFTGIDQGDPTPKYARTGLSVTADIAFKSEWKIIEWKGGRSAGDELIEPRDDWSKPFKYQTGLGDIDFVKHVIKSKPEDGIQISRGDEFTFFDFYTVRWGRYIDTEGHVRPFTRGYGYRASGLIRLISSLMGSPLLRVLSRYVDVRYDYSKWMVEPGHPLRDTDFAAWTITIKNMDQLLIGLFE